MFESFDATLGSFRQRFNGTVRTVAHVTNNLMTRRRALRKKSIPDSLHVTADQEFSRYSQTTPNSYLHFINRASLPFSSSNVSVSSESPIFKINFIVLPLISPL